ncbi:MAG TPA: hypothetical protein VKT49_06865 [Bryobacteraceae bacterium]|nr:hypothetical protein [Bryobacteraceae bacterium]
MNDPSTYWLTFTNIGLGVVVLICCLAVAVGVFQEVAARHKKRIAASALDREVSDLAETYVGGHAFNLPNLGVTMADGGEELRKKEPRASS